VKENLGALAERNFRLVFSAQTISALGDGVSRIALVFAVLAVSHNSATDVGLVIAARQLAAAGITVAAGVFSDRLPRHLVLVIVSVVQGVAQTTAGALVVSGHATVLALAGLAVVYGLADGFTIPAGQGLVPTIVSSARLQQANALLGLSRSILGILGPAVGGVLVALGSPGSGLLVDAATFFVAAVLVMRVAIPPRADEVTPEPFLTELRQGWDEFRKQTWIWTTIVFFGIGNCAGAALGVLGPLVAKQHLGGAGAWAALVAADAAGAIIGGLVALRVRVTRPLLVSCISAVPYGLLMLALGLRLPLPALIAISAFAGASLAVHLALWFTVFQQQVPERSRSRVSSYDAVGSFVLIPLGAAIAGPIAAVAGTSATLIGASLITFSTIGIVIAQPSVRAIRTPIEPSVAPA
jgi:hypothetical protein